jgi:PAS domain S-box-containing protein
VSGSVRILHVDDDSSFTTLVKQFLTRENDRFEIVAETSAEDGLDRLAEEEFDCIVSDYEMPEMDGLDFLEAVRGHGYEIPFIMFTGTGSEHIASEAISAGVTDYIKRGNGTDQYALLANRQRELAATRRRLALFVEQSPFGVIEWSSDARIRRLNETAEQLLGYEQSELRGKSWKALFPKHRQEVVADVVETLLAGGDVDRTIAETLMKDGETILCDWHTHFVEHDDEIVAGFSQFQNVTDRVETRRRLETMIENLPGIVYRYREGADQPFELVSGSCEELTGYTATQLQEEISLDEELVHPDDQEDVQAEMLAQEPTEGYELTYRIRRKDGEIRQIWEHGQQYESRREQAEFREGLLIDVTEITAQSRKTA